MSNRAEYACLAVLLVTAISAFFYEKTENSPEQDHSPTTVTTDSVGLSATNDTRDDPRPHASRPSREREDGRGLNELGMMYVNGTGARRDLSTAFLLLSWAAQTGDVAAMNNLGRMYEEGWGTDSDLKRASELYTKAAQLGNQLARDNLHRLRATYPEASTTLLSISASRATATSPFTRDWVESSRSGKPKPMRITARYTWATGSHIAEDTALGSSSDTGWSTSAIPFSRPVVAQNPAPPQTKKLRGSTPPRKPPVTQSFPRMQPQEPEIGKPTASKMPVNEKAGMSQLAEQSASNNPRGKSTTKLGFVDPADTLSSLPCVVGNWTGTPRC